MAKKAKSKYLRYLVHYWTDYYNDNGKYRHTERQFSDGDKAVNSALAFVNNHDQALVIDLFETGSKRVVYSSSP